MKGIQTVCIISDERVDALSLDVRRRSTTPLSSGHVAYRGPDCLLTEYGSEALAEAVAKAVQTLQTAADSLTLVIPMQWCFVHRLAANGNRPTDEALSYELEPNLPIGLEELTCVFVPCANATDSWILAIAVPTRPMAELLGCLEDRGVTVDRLLADAPLIHEGRAGNETTNRLIRDSRWARGLVKPTTLSSGIIVEPTTTLGASACANHTVPESQNGSEDRPVVLDFAYTARPAETAPSAGNGSPAAKPQADCPLVELATLAVRANPSNDLRTGELAAGGRWDRAVKLTTHCLVVTILLLAVVCSGLHLKTRAVRANIAAVQEAQLQTYAEVIATDVLPTGAALRLASERVRWQGLTRGEKPTDSPSSPRPEPLSLLREFVAALPGEVRVLLHEARIEGGQFVLRGATVSHHDAERITEVLQKVKSVTPRPPRTSRLAGGGVRFSISAGVSDGS